MKNHPLFHKFLKSLRRLEVSPHDQLFVAVSGGADSVALFSLLNECQKVIPFELVMVSIHHGPSEVSHQLEFRDEALEFCRQMALKFNISFLTNKEFPQEPLKNEEEMRDFRGEQIQRLMSDKGKEGLHQWVVLGHHEEDLIETQFIHLIRGSGLVGLNSLKEKCLDSRRLRPLLSVRPEDLRGYLEDLGIPWREDPSNQSQQALRNWLRNQWLPELEAYRPGAKSALARSFRLILEEACDTISQSEEEQILGEKLSRASLLTLPEGGQRRLIARFFRSLGVKNYSRSHLEEFLKRIDTRQTDLTFRLLNRDWVVSRDFIQLS